MSKVVEDLLSNKKLLSEWSISENGELTPQQLTGGNANIWWKCPEGDDHLWQATVQNRVRNSSGCPYCSGSKADRKTNLLVKNPEIASQWHTTRNGKLKPTDFRPSSNKKVWWQCPEDNTHIYKSSIGNRTNQLSGCPYCRSNKVNENNSLLALRPELSKEWHPIKNGTLKPNHFRVSSEKKVWWQCKRFPEHEWEAIISNRSKKKPTGCPHCTKQRSYPEIRILAELKSLFENVQSRYKINRAEVDIFISDINVAIEFDGYHWHKNRETQDREKNKKIKPLIKTLIRVREKPLPTLSKSDIIFSDTQHRELIKSDLDKLVKKIKKYSPLKFQKRLSNYLTETEFLDEELYNKFVSYFPNPFPEESLEATHPIICKDWDFEKNFPLTPRQFTSGSHKKVWWKCSKSNYHFQKQAISGRSSGKGCSFCAGQKVCEDNNLTFLRPDLAKQWHPTKNENLKPTMVTAGSDRDGIWWKCPEGEDHEWVAKVSQRARGRGCPYCAGRKVGKDNNLKILNPNLAGQWHPTKNGNRKPEDFTLTSGVKIWWKCPKGDDHEWEEKISNRKRDQKHGGCPYCSSHQTFFVEFGVNSSGFNVPFFNVSHCLALSGYKTRKL